MPQSSAQVTAAEISRIAGVTRATVSNWRRRHSDFPAPTGGTETSPLCDLETVRAWLRSRGQTSAAAPAEDRLGPWFLMGFLNTDDNIAGASVGSTAVHLQPGRLRVPLLPLEEQRRYGEAFRRISELRAASRRAADLAQEYTGLLTAGLTAGALLPPDTASL
ncbi:hypothetical protein ACFZAG_35620 [Streptomyces sp. NPDC012403]|jgi:hypothetical protein|uniref:hypothetical protein n=1 Tax=Streptomyces sp. NPDC012403 TaxID=3364831 RepID=UPI0036E830EB